MVPLHGDGDQRVLRHAALRGIGLLLIAGLAALGDAGCSRIVVPPATPNTTVESNLTLRWALVRDGGTVRAVGSAESSSAGSNWDATLALEGVDGDGHLVSRGVAIVRPGFGPGPTAFEAELTPTGGETEYRLRVVRLQQYTRPGR